MSSRTILYYNEHFLISLRNVERRLLVSFHIALSDPAGFWVLLCGFALCIIDVWHIGAASSPPFLPTLSPVPHTHTHLVESTLCIRVTSPYFTYCPHHHHHHHHYHHIITITMIITTIIVIAIISSSPSPPSLLSPCSLASPHFCSYGCSSSPLIGKSSCHL